MSDSCTRYILEKNRNTFFIILKRGWRFEEKIDFFVALFFDFYPSSKKKIFLKWFFPWWKCHFILIIHNQFPELQELIRNVNGTYTSRSSLSSSTKASSSSSLNNEQIQHVKGLPTLQSLKLFDCKFNGDLHTTFLDQWEYLKRLSIRDINSESENQSSLIVGSSNKWLENRYRSLEEFELISSRQIDDVTKFLVKNRNIQKFSIV